MHNYVPRRPEQYNAATHECGKMAELDLLEVGREFVTGREGRLPVFGIFK